MNPPKPLAYHWWKRGLDDGSECARKRRPHLFEQYRAVAMLALAPGDFEGVCSFVYTRAFRVGYDATKERKERESIYWKKPRKSATNRKASE